MPQATEASTSQRYHRISPLSAASEISSPQQYPNIASSMSSMQSQSMSQSQNVSQSHLALYATGGPVQPLQHYQQPMPQPSAVPVRPSSGAWTPADDAQLMAARAQGLNWQPIQSAYFPNKTPNACRKRHERLMDRRNSDDWDVVKFETLAKEYMGMRREIWSPLSAKTGEKWTVIEAKCLQSGLKNLQAAARSCNRRERLENPSGGSGMLSVQHPTDGGYDDPHGEDGGVGLDELEAEYHSADTASYGQDSPDREPRGGPVKLYPAPPVLAPPPPRPYDPTTGIRTSYDRDAYRTHMSRVSTSSTATTAPLPDPDPDRAYLQPQMHHHPRHPHHHPLRSPYGLHPHQQQRLPSIDMGIPAIMNRPPGSL